MFLRKKKSGDRTYLQVVKNRWEDGGAKQRVIATIGRLDRLQDSGELDGLVRSAARFCQSVMVLDVQARGDAPKVRTRRIGPAVVFERLWRETGCRDVIEALTALRSFRFRLERALFLTALQRLFHHAPKRCSDREAVTWRAADEVESAGAPHLQLHHICRAMAWLGEPLSEQQQDARKPYAPRTTKDLIEERLFARRRDLFTGLDQVFLCITLIYFEGEGGQTLGERGKSKDHRRDVRQMVVAVVGDSEGRPICCEPWPGNTFDGSGLIPIAERLQRRFRVSRICVVADHEMFSASLIEELERRGWFYILGGRMRAAKEVQRDVLSRAGRYKLVRTSPRRRQDSSPLKAKQVMVEGRRYVVCLNEEQKKKDAADREAIVATLRELLPTSDKSFVGNKGYRKFVSTCGAQYELDEAAIKREARCDGKWVLRTNTSLDTAEVALKYKQLRMVEAIFRTSKSLVETRRVFHEWDATIRGHVFCSFLALVLRTELQARLERAGHDLEWDDVVRDLANLAETEVVHQGKRFVLRETARGVSGKVFQAVGVALPPTVRQLDDEMDA